MNQPSTASLLAAQLLADAQRQPSALRFSFSGGDVAALFPLLQEEEFDTLAARLPCVVEDGPAVAGHADGLRELGCRLAGPSDIAVANERFPDPVPTGAAWIGGTWYLAPPGRPVGTQSASRAVAMELVQLVSADADTHELEAVLRKDPTLSYHLLRLVNSLGMATGKKISSFSQAILILGRAQLRRWLNLMLFSSREGDERSGMLLAHVAVRARMLELLARAAGLDRSGQDMAFMAGMFSLLGVLFGLPLPEVLKPLQINETLQAALLERDGDLGTLLLLAEAAEGADFDAIAARCGLLQIPAGDFNAAVVQAHAWMADVLRGARGGGDA